LKGKIFQVVLVLVLLVVTGLTGCIKAQEEVSSSGPSMPPEFFLNSDGDGFNDWFETNIAHYDPSVPNDRYVILFDRHPEEEGLTGVADTAWHFFTEKGKVPPENIIILKQEEATGPNLKNAIAEVARRSDENDIVFLNIQTHGYTIASFSSGDENMSSWEYMDEGYTMIDEWLDEIRAKVVVVTIMACGSERALPLMKDGPCPRILFIDTAGEFIGALGQDPNCVAKSDIEYGNNDGYISLAEIGNWRNNEPRGWKDNELGEGKSGDGYWDGESWFEKFGFSLMSDTSNVAHQIYLTDYTPYDIPLILRISQVNNP
jgi:hypothetical protein